MHRIIPSESQKVNYILSLKLNADDAQIDNQAQKAIDAQNSTLLLQLNAIDAQIENQLLKAVDAQNHILSLKLNAIDAQIDNLQLMRRIITYCWTQWGAD